MGAIEAFDRLNERQREAARFPGRPLLIIAGAGTGKTSTLAHRVAHLVLEGVAPEAILLLTFTRRAAAEMTRRAQRIVGEALTPGPSPASGRGEQISAIRLPWSGTFHSIANRLIRRHATRVGLEPSFSVLDRGDAADLMDVVRHELGLSKTEKRFPRKDTCLAIYSHRVSTQAPLAATLEAAFPWCAEWEAALKRLFAAYVERKLASQALDYDDLLLYWHAMMQDTALAGEIGARFAHVLVDEYQDTNLVQAEILKALRPAGEGLTVVGDDAQAIYSFRAATVENILAFEREYGAAVVRLEENYRSTQAVLDAANALMGESATGYRKELRAHTTPALRATPPRGGGEKPHEPKKPKYVTVLDDAAQARYVVERVLEAREAGVMLRRQAVLFRSSHHSDVLELELVRRNIPYVKYGGLKFLEAAHVKDLLALLRWADNPRNRVAAFRALQLQEGVGPGTAARVFEKFEAAAFAWSGLRTAQGLVELMAFLGDPRTPWPGQVRRAREWYAPALERLHDAGEVRSGDLEQLERIAAGFETRERFLTELALDPPAATGDLAGEPHRDEDYLVLSTVHSAKGQEWDAVFVLNVADGNFPNEHATGRPDLVEEERRLLYVAMTRAKTSLHLIAPLKYYVTQQSRTGDRHVYGARSRFMTEAVMACLEQVTYGEAEGEELNRQAKASVDVAGRLRKMWS
ncbi:MAG: ATP-dependent DNA helicase [Betaproteobacteria bacterium RIFCSPLOWO2_12_FULL_68_20]|nr:MAG: ATP-dependent DNA helicase [Betaproteobacteria bacterium RIFCSPLOWO2_12_FULL_68_20]